MSISLVTDGMLWPVGGGLVIREQFVDIHVKIEDPQKVTLEMREVEQVTASVDSEDIIAKVEVEDGISSTVEDPDEITVKKGDC